MNGLWESAGFDSSTLEPASREHRQKLILLGVAGILGLCLILLLWRLYQFIAHWASEHGDNVATKPDDRSNANDRLLCDQLIVPEMTHPWWEILKKSRIEEVQYFQQQPKRSLKDPLPNSGKSSIGSGSTATKSTTENLRKNSSKN